MNRSLYEWVAILAIAASPFLSQSLADSTEDKLAGTWEFEQTLQNGSKLEMTLKLEHDGEKLSGTFFLGKLELKIKEGRVSKGEVNITVEKEVNDRTVQMLFKGKLEGDTIKGEIKTTRDGAEVQTIVWDARRSVD